MIHLGYAYELSSRELAMEALGLAATSHNRLHRYIDDPSYTKTTENSSASLSELLARIAEDMRFDGIFTEPGGDNMEVLFRDHESLVLEYWNSWALVDAKKQFGDSQLVATCLLAATQGQYCRSYDFFLVHSLTSSHAIRIILPFIPPSFHVSLVRQWWLLTLTVYIAQLRPTLDTKSILNHERAGRTWAWVDREALESKWRFDAHYVKALRAMKEAAITWDDKDLFYLKAALKFAADFEGWSGLGA